MNETINQLVAELGSLTLSDLRHWAKLNGMLGRVERDRDALLERISNRLYRRYELSR
jgi:hypothetical protein